MKRGNFLKILGIGLLGSKISFSNATKPIENSPFVVPNLGFAFNALEPHIDAQTMEIHHDRHHQAYVTNLNKAIVGTSAEKMSLEDIVKTVSKHSTVIRNNAGGHWNHTFFWEILSPKPTVPSAKVTAAINNFFGGIDKMQAEFNAAASTRFGSGWAWLILNEGTLKICSTPNQDNPLMDLAEVKGVPILGIDVWEHAYYLKYQNKRAEYIKAFWNVVNWDAVERNLDKAY